jgi:hypothetical protein
MTQTTVAGDIQQTFNAHLYFGTQLAFHFELIGNDVTDGIQLIIVPLVNLLIHVNPCFFKDVPGSGLANPENVGQTNFPSFIFW